MRPLAKVNLQRLKGSEGLAFDMGESMANTYYNVNILLCIDRAFLGEYSNALWKSLAGRSLQLTVYSLEAGSFQSLWRSERKSRTGRRAHPLLNPAKGRPP